MNVKHLVSVVLAVVSAGAVGLAQAEPNLAPYCHAVIALCTVAQPYLAMTSPQAKASS